MIVSQVATKAYISLHEAHNNLAHHPSSIHYHHIAAVSSHVLYRKSHLAFFTIYFTALAVLLPTLLLHSYYS